MGVSDWSSIIQTIALIYLGWRQNRIFDKQNEIFAVQAGQAVMPANASRFSTLKRYWPTFVMLGVMILTAYDIYDRHASHTAKVQTFDWSKPLTIVRGQIFVNEKVDVDGKDFIDCTFRNVTFVYNGTDRVGMSHSNIITPSQISTDSDSVVGTIVLLKGIGDLASNFDITAHHKPLPNIQAPDIK